jgi:arylsulfatase A-like enzyme
MRLFRITLSILFVATFALASFAADGKKPNILFIVGDDMGYADVGFNGCKDIPTPNLDSLAKSGVRFSNGYVSAPYCSPSRAGLLTGKYQQRFGHEFNPSGSKTGLPVDQTTIANRLKANGYATGLVGKWHLGSLPEMQPPQRGFDEFFGFLGGAHSYFSYNGMMRGTEPVNGDEYFTDAFAREGSAFIQKHKDQPWFLYLAFNAVHTPMHATDDRLAKFANIQDKTRRTYAAMMFALDEAIGRIRKAVAESGHEENTLVVFFSDNGGPTMPGTTMNGSINKPFRGSKRTTLEGGIHVPSLLSWKGHVTPAVYDSPIFQLDFTATALESAGLKVPDLNGVNLLPYLSGENKNAPHDALYWRFGDQMAIRVGDYKLVRYDANVDLRTGKKEPATEAKLYNLASDIGESKDLAANMPEKVKELQTKWDAWNGTLMKPLWGWREGDNDGDPGEKDAKKAKKKK